MPFREGISMKLQLTLGFRFAALSRRGIGNFFAGCCVPVLLCAVITQATHAQTLTTLVSFTGSNGSDPLFAPLLQGTDGNLYGTTSGGGAHGHGTVFKVTTAGALKTLYSFCAKSGCADGSAPYAGLIQAKDGNFYGTTEAGGSNNAGTVFKITAAGTLTTLHKFNYNDGANPYAALVQALDGNFYGTTESGGAHILGTVFKMTTTGTLTTLHSFNLTDGSSPEAALIQAADGHFYSTTYNGGPEGYGTVFKITSGGTLTTLHTFTDSDGRAVVPGLVQASDGNFYGAGSQGGNNGYGTVFMMTPQGTLTTLHSFNATDGATPNQLALGSDGKFYGTTISGGTNTDGTIFEITPQGVFTSLHSFAKSDGADPFAGLVQDTDGKFYGTTSFGGAKNSGTIFRLDVGLGPFVEAVPTVGKIGAKVKILGTKLTGATSVSFNGTAAAFAVVSASEITTSVPAGATTGTVQVTTPSATLSSNAVFQVTP
jgi:uncharacterized repeat protein (TIGR03803 family)